MTLLRYKTVGPKYVGKMFDRNSVCMTIIGLSRALICRLTYYRLSIMPQICSPPSIRSRDAVSPLFRKHISFFVNEFTRHMLDGQGYKPHSVSVARDLLFYLFRRGKYLSASLRTLSMTTARSSTISALPNAITPVTYHDQSPSLR